MDISIEFDNFSIAHSHYTTLAKEDLTNVVHATNKRVKEVSRGIISITGIEIVEDRELYKAFFGRGEVAGFKTVFKDELIAWGIGIQVGIHDVPSGNASEPDESFNVRKEGTGPELA